MKKVLIICQCATNKGDRAIAEYLLDRLGGQTNEITLSTTEPSLWADLSSARVIPTGYRQHFPMFKNSFLRRVSAFLTRKLYEYVLYPDLIKADGKHKKCEKDGHAFVDALRKADLVIVTGGHHITSIRNENALFPITYDIGLASLYAKRLVLWSQTIGPLEFSDEKAKAFFGRVLSGADQIYIRDANSRRCLEAFPQISKEKIHTSYDSVFGFGTMDFPAFAARKKKVGISIFNGLKKSLAIYPQLAELLDHVVQKGYCLEFFRMENGDRELEDIHRLISMMKTKPDFSIFPFQTTTKEHLAELSECSFYIGHKTHSVIMSLTTATPLLALCYHEKTLDFMKDYGLEEYALDDTDFSAEAAIAVMDRLMENGQHVHQTMRLRSRQIAEQVAEDLRSMMYEA